MISQRRVSSLLGPRPGAPLTALTRQATGVAPALGLGAVSTNRRSFSSVSPSSLKTAPAPNASVLPFAQKRHVAQAATSTPITAPPSRFLEQDEVRALMAETGVPLVSQQLADRNLTAVEAAVKSVQGYPVVIKATGVLHKADIGGVFCNVKSSSGVENVLTELNRIETRREVLTGDQVLVQPMIKNALPTELYVGAVFEPGYGHLMTLGVGGFTVELHRDTSTYLVGANQDVREKALRRLHVYDGIFGSKGYRGCPPLAESTFFELLDSVEHMISAYPQILELDLNPVLYCSIRKKLMVVDARVRMASL